MNEPPQIEIQIDTRVVRPGIVVNEGTGNSICRIAVAKSESDAEIEVYGKGDLARQLAKLKQGDRIVGEGILHIIQRELRWGKTTQIAVELITISINSHSAC